MPRASISTWKQGVMTLRHIAFSNLKTLHIYEWIHSWRWEGWTLYHCYISSTVHYIKNVSDCQPHRLDSVTGLYLSTLEKRIISPFTLPLDMIKLTSTSPSEDTEGYRNFHKICIFLYAIFSLHSLIIFLQSPIYSGPGLFIRFPLPFFVFVAETISKTVTNELSIIWKKMTLLFKGRRLFSVKRIDSLLRLFVMIAF